MVYVGMARATTLMRISLPSMDMSFSFQLANFFPTFSLISANTYIFDFAMIEGRLKYFLLHESCIDLRIIRISSLVSWGVLGLKNTDDLSVLIFSLEAVS